MKKISEARQHAVRQWARERLGEELPPYPGEGMSPEQRAARRQWWSAEAAFTTERRGARKP